MKCKGTLNLVIGIVYRPSRTLKPLTRFLSLLTKSILKTYSINETRERGERPYCPRGVRDGQLFI